MSSSGGGKSADTMYADELERRMAEKLTVRCSLCEGRRFKRTGPAAKVIRAIAEHRALEHPHVVETERFKTFRERAAIARERERSGRAAKIMGEATSPAPDEVAA